MLSCHAADLRGLRRVFIKNGYRNPGPEVLELRAALVDHKKGSLKGVPVKLHYDDNRRVSLERRDYFYAPLPGTPFGLAVAIPNYGTTWIKVILSGYRVYTRIARSLRNPGVSWLVPVNPMPQTRTRVLEIVERRNFET